MPPQVANYLVQLRRRNVVLRWTTPSWGRADVIIREVSQAVTLCTGQLKKRRPTPLGEAPRLWSESRLFTARTYDPQLFDEVEARRLVSAPTDVWAMYWGPGALVRSGYDTYDAVTALGWSNEAGVCISCGGDRPRPKCSCHKDKARNPAAATAGGVGAGERSEAPRRPAAVPLVKSDRVAALLPAAQDAAEGAGSLSLVDAVSLSAAEWAAEDGG